MATLIAPSEFGTRTGHRKHSSSRLSNGYSDRTFTRYLSACPLELVLKRRPPQPLTVDAPVERAGALSQRRQGTYLMMWFENLRTSAKLSGAFGLMIVLLLAIGWVGLSSAKATKENQDATFEVDFKTATLAGAMSTEQQ